jgi:hypothetical protein
MNLIKLVRATIFIFIIGYLKVAGTMPLLKNINEEGGLENDADFNLFSLVSSIRRIKAASNQTREAVCQATFRLLALRNSYNYNQKLSESLVNRYYWLASNSSCFLISKKALKFNDAEQQCSDFNISRLFYIQNEKELTHYNFLRNHLQLTNNKKIGEKNRTYSYFIGLSYHDLGNNLKLKFG